VSQDKSLACKKSSWYYKKSGY